VTATAIVAAGETGTATARTNGLQVYWGGCHPSTPGRGTDPPEARC
jgi:hypothetical protein